MPTAEAGETVAATPAVDGTTVPEEGTTVPEDTCVADAALGLAVGNAVKLRLDAIIRDAPGGNDTGRRGENKNGTITSGPECANDLVWWEVKVGDESGWTAEQTESKVRLILEP